MTDLRNLISKLAAQEVRLRQTAFLAPCVRGGKVRTRVEGLVYTFTPEPSDFEGWGLFRPSDAERAVLEEEAGLRQIEAYLRLFSAFRVRLALSLQGRTWLAYPANASDAQQRLGHARPFPVHLVADTRAFEQGIARWDGAAWWYEAEDRKADPRLAAYLRDAFKAETAPEALRQAGLTPEMSTAYSLAWSRTETYRARQREAQAQAHLESALSFAGGRLQDFQDRGDYWVVGWTTQEGEEHHSAIGKRDLTVLSAGICLSDQDQDFDLQSLVGVVERRPDWM